jgi:hypothetical protein
MLAFTFGFTDFWGFVGLILLFVIPVVVYEARKTKRKIGRVRCQRCHYVGPVKMGWVPFRGLLPVCPECDSPDWEKVQE